MGRTWIVAQEHAEPTAAVSEAAPVAAGRAVRGEHATCVAWCESADAHAVLSVGYADGSIACFEVRSSALPGKPGKAGGAGDGLGSLVLNVTPTLSIDLEKAGVIKACAGTRAVVDVRWDGAGDCLAAVYCCGGCVLWSPGGGVMGYTLEAGSGDSEEEDEGDGVDAEARRAWTGGVGEIAGAGGGLAWSTDGYQLYVPAGGGGRLVRMGRVQSGGAGGWAGGGGRGFEVWELCRACVGGGIQRGIGNGGGELMALKARCGRVCVLSCLQHMETPYASLRACVSMCLRVRLSFALSRTPARSLFARLHFCFHAFVYACSLLVSDCLSVCLSVHV